MLACNGKEKEKEEEKPRRPNETKKIEKKQNHEKIGKGKITQKQCRLAAFGIWCLRYSLEFLILLGDMKQGVDRDGIVSCIC